MRTQPPRPGTRLARYGAASLLLWIVALGAAYLYLRGTLPPDARALPLTHADSIGLPLVSLALLLAAVLIVANLVAAGVLLRRRRPGSRRG